MFWVEFVDDGCNRTAGAFETFEEAEKFAENLGLVATDNCDSPEQDGEYRMAKD